MEILRGSQGVIAMAAVLLLAVSGCASSGEEVVESPAAEFRALSLEWSEDYVGCLRDKGVDAKLVEGRNGQLPSIDPAYGPGAELWEGMLDLECVESVGEPPNPPEPTTEFTEAYYDLMVVQAECLRSEGYVVSEAPPKDEWVEGGGPPVWAPSVDVMEAGRDIEPALDVCPEPIGIEIEQHMHDLQDAQ